MHCSSDTSVVQTTVHSLGATWEPLCLMSTGTKLMALGRQVRSFDDELCAIAPDPFAFCVLCAVCCLF